MTSSISLLQAFLLVAAFPMLLAGCVLFILQRTRRGQSDAMSPRAARLAPFLVIGAFACAGLAFLL